MVMDIDQFLNKFEKDIKEKRKEYDLEFQKDVEERISKIQENIEDKDINLLKDIYEAIKKFDQDLPNKFLGIENKSGLALQNLGQKYSTQFLTINKNNSILLKNKINENFVKISENLKNENFKEILFILKEIKNDFALFPKSLIKEKTQISNLIKEKEIEIFSKLEIFKEKETKRIKTDLNLIIQELKKSLIKKDILLIEKNISEVKSFMSNIPKIILSQFTFEKIKINKVLIVAENYLLNCYKNEFKYRINVINMLIEKFHANVIKKNIKTCVLIYNEILIEFKNIPEIFLDEKINLYNKINQLFTQLNNLLMKSNIEMFLESYNHSKKIEATREYLRHVKESKTVNTNNLNFLKEEIKSLPTRLNEENNFLTKDIENIEKENLITKQIENLHNDKNDKNKLGIKNNVNSNMLKEIGIYYDRLKKSNNEVEIQKLYEKIIFYLRLVKIEKDKKIEILKKIKLTLRKKGINK